MFNSNKFLAIVFSILLVAITQNASAISEPDVFTFYGKGKVEPSSSFAGEIVRTIIDDEKAAIIHSTSNGMVVVRLALSENETCTQKISTVCFDATVTQVRGTDIHVGDKVSLTIDLENKKETISVTSGQFQGENIVIDLTKTRTRDNGEFSIMFTQEGGIAGMQRKVTIDSTTKIMIIKNNADESQPVTLSDDDIIQLRDIIQGNGFFDFNIKEYPAISGSADYFAYNLEVTTKHFTNNIQWTDTSENTPKKLNLINEKLQDIILSFTSESAAKINQELS
jgi:hypothetical protein